MVSGGKACTDPDDGYSGYPFTYLNTHSPFTGNGTIRSWCVSAHVAGTCKLKVFRSNGSNYDFIGESATENISIGWNTGFECDIAVQSGDYIGAYINAGGHIYDSGGDVGYYYSTSYMDITSNTAKTEWSSNGTANLLIGASDIVAGIYVDINRPDDSGDGLSWSTAKKTLSAGYTALTAGRKLHVASGTYSYSGITFNKSWKLSPEDPNSTGAKNVKIGA